MGGSTTLALSIAAVFAVPAIAVLVTMLVPGELSPFRIDAEKVAAIGIGIVATGVAAFFAVREILLALAA